MISPVKGQFVRSSPTSRNQSSDGGECAALADTETQRWKLHPLSSIPSVKSDQTQHIDINTHRDRDRETETHTDTQTHRHADT